MIVAMMNIMEMDMINIRGKWGGQKYSDDEILKSEKNRKKFSRYDMR